jgi:hypothetical protein
MTRTTRRVWLLVGFLCLLIVVGCIVILMQPIPRAAEIRPQREVRALPVTLPAIWHVAETWKSSGRGKEFSPGTFFFPEIMGAGCALFDFDRDGKLDVYLIQGAGSRPRGGSTIPPPRNRLLRQVSAGKFEDVSAGSGLDVADVGMGIAVGDINNDGWPDVFLANYGADRLLLNQRNGKFLDISAAAGIEDLNWGASACFVDYDRDGWLDLCVANYLDYDPGHPCPDAEGALDYCNPKLFHGVAARLYRNISGMGIPGGDPVDRPRFQDVSWDSGIGQLKGPGLGVVSGDFNGDRWPDLVVANDGAANHLWLNQRNGTFIEEAVPRSAAYDNQGRAQANMGIALGDPDGDGDADLFVTHLRGENNALYLNDPHIGFAEESARSGLALPSIPFTGFGTAFLDLDLDGDLDVAVVNGAVRRPRLGTFSKNKLNSALEYWPLYAERNQVFLNGGRRSFQELAADSQPFCQDLTVARGLAMGDIDNDGDIDLLVSEANGTSRLFLNQAPRKGHWLLIQAVEPTMGGRDAYGAQITISCGQKTWTSWVNAAGSYLSSSDPRVHFGLGDATEVTTITVVWPNGDEEVFPGGPVDRQVKLSHGAGAKP